jgi:hypothetical protein
VVLARLTRATFVSSGAIFNRAFHIPPAASIRSRISFGIPLVSKSIKHQAGTPG